MHLSMDSVVLFLSQAGMHHSDNKLRQLSCNMLMLSLMNTVCECTIHEYESTSKKPLGSTHDPVTVEWSQADTHLMHYSWGYSEYRESRALPCSFSSANRNNGQCDAYGRTEQHPDNSDRRTAVNHGALRGDNLWHRNYTIVKWEHDQVKFQSFILSTLYRKWAPKS